MTFHHADRDVPPPGCPAHAARTPLYGPEFAANPGRVYTQLRRHGPIAPVELAPGIPATLVTGYQTALEVLRDPDRFPKDPRQWQQKIPADCPVLPMMMYRPNCLFADGARHARLRKAMTDSLDRVDSTAVRNSVERAAGTLLDRFAPAGHADLLTQYARVLPLLTLSSICGSPAEIGHRMLTAMSAVFDGINAEQANADLGHCLAELVALKRSQPASDVTSWLMAHPAALTDDEILHQLVVLMGAGSEPQQNLIANTLRLLLSDDRFAGDLSGGTLPVDEALDEVLWTDPPMANYGITYPMQDLELAGTRLPAHQPVVISYAAANTDPSLATDQTRTGNRAHLAFSAGPHTCPAPRLARVIASAAIERLLDRLPDMRLAVAADDLRWRPGPFHRALESLPVAFPPLPLSQVKDQGDRRWATTPAPTLSTPPEPTFTPKPPNSASKAPRRWWNSLAAWWRGQ
ncbi:cytochrome P450 [Saccharopolyspora hattusasensis]|uniref:cytochrome P450 n=1 Tax=Saccharopolyspora hattusasensis TaxID=1128679 RepID=UPI003D989270